MRTIKENVENVRERIDRALSRSGRRDEVTLVAVSKTYPVDRINEAIRAGVRDIGENRVGEAEEKHPKIIEGARLHLVGHLQRNKVKRAVGLFSMIQSIDKVETALEMEKRAVFPVDILVEINASGEITKSGVTPEGLFDLVEQLKPLNMIRIRGLMTIGPFTENEAKIRECFVLTRRKFEKLQKSEPGLDIKYLSMGMSSDYEIAIEEGSNMVRIGTAIFGTRSS
ncbi:MAG TPA: YggS family pyridoxal phosphate-dependent enzyme [Spirochaetota bacterium]|nr:YggS family pyridoxal phosphate-dependent enzyme [Spirochaetota bacterium]